MVALITSNAANAPARQPLSDFQRFVIANDDIAARRAAEEELTSYAGRVAGRKLEVGRLGKVAADAPGQALFVGDGAAVA